MTTVYIFLAVVLAPVLVKGGPDPLAAHTFIFYWSMVSYITPLVVLGTYAAAVSLRHISAFTTLEKLASAGAR
jgi:TRAP-type uncharacterized transport system fused permease subunit